MKRKRCDQPDKVDKDSRLYSQILAQVLVTCSTEQEARGLGMRQGQPHLQCTPPRLERVRSQDSGPVAP